MTVAGVWEVGDPHTTVIAGFILAPDAIIRSIGFALAAAVLFDAIVVRMTIVPAVMTLLGKAA